MKRIIYIVMLITLISTSSAKAQWVTFDPSNMLQGILNTTKNIVETSATAANTLKAFEESKKIYDQGRKYYDALKSVNDLVQDAKKVQQIILMIGDISEIYIVNFQRMLQDENFTTEELSAIAFGYTKLLQESTYLLDEVKEIIDITSLSMTDKERMDVIDRTHKSVRQYRNLVNYFTRKTMCVSFLRSKELGTTSRFMTLYGSSSDKYW